MVGRSFNSIRRTLMFENQLFNGILGKGFDLLGGSDTPKGGQEKRYEKIKINNICFI